MKTVTWKVEIGEKIVAEGTAKGTDAEAAKIVALRQIVHSLQTALWLLPPRTEHVQHTD